MTRFFATLNDMRKGLEKVEQEYSLKYVIEGMYTVEQYPVYYSFADIPSLGTTNTARAGTPTYLVFKYDDAINSRLSTFEDGTVASIIKIEENPSAFLFRPGGWYIGEKFQEKLLLGGDIGIYRNESIETEKLCKDFSRRLTDKFKSVGRSVDKIKWKVGQEAHQALLDNVRLVTEEATFSKKWDLSIPSE